MAIHYFFKLDGIAGESQHRDHRDEIEVLSWSWGLSSPTPAGGGGGGSGAGRATPADFTFVHRYDKASPVLARTAASGRHVREAVLSARRSGQGQRDFLKITLKELRITSVQHQGSGDQIVEIVSCSMRQIGSEYKPQAANGALGAAVSFDWNVATGAVTGLP